MDELKRLEKRLAREKLARQQMEKIAEDKTREIFHANQELEALAKSLEEKVIERTADLQLAKEQEQEVRKFLENLLDSAKEVAIIATDPDGLITKFNTGAQNLVEVSMQNACSRNIVSFFNEQDINTLLPTIKDEDDLLHSIYEFCQQEKSKSLELHLINSKQNKIICSVSVSMILDVDNKTKAYLFIIKDIRVRKNIERMQSEFISTVSHELRTPLTSICGSLTLILRGKLGEIPAPICSLLAIAEKNTKRLTALINDILDMEKIVAGKMKLKVKPYSLFELAQQAMDENQSYAAQFKVNLSLSKGIKNDHVLVDEKRFLQIMANLLSNAIKFSKKGDIVKVSMKSIDDFMILSVIDKGEGIPNSFKDKIFKKFSQADSSDTRKVGGTGLGLSISKELTDKMGGTLTFDSIEGEGTTFNLKLPKHDVVCQNYTPATKKSVLIIEDNEDVASLIKLILEKEGITADYALSAKDALRMVELGSYQALTVDVELPDMNGMDLIKKIRKIKGCQDIPIFVVSGFLEEESSTNPESTVIDWLSKPIDQTKLCELVKTSIMKKGRIDKVIQILHIEDDADIRHILSLQLKEIGEYIGVSTIAEVHKIQDLSQFDLFILDLNLPDGSGTELIDVIHKQNKASNIIILSAQELSEHYVDKVKSVFVKSKMSAEDLKQSIQAILRPEGDVK